MTLRVWARTLAAGAIGAAALLSSASMVHAQTGCRTANCSLSTTPPVQCTGRATPYTTTVLMLGTLVFSPSLPKIEPGDCISWTASGSALASHSSSASDCTDTGTVCTVVDTTCQWDSGNANANDSPPSEICFYNTTSFPAGTADGFYCRIHASPTAGTMRGTMSVTTAIDVQVAKDTVAGDVVLSWTGGGVTGDVTYRVVRNLVGDPLFAVGANTVTGSPDGGNTGTTFRELGGLSDHTTHYYLVRNRQTTE